MRNEIIMDRDDVTVEEVVDECEICTSTITGSAWRVMVDYRSAGFATPAVEIACAECAEEAAARIRDGLAK